LADTPGKLQVDESSRGGEIILPEFEFAVFNKDLDFAGYLVIDSMVENRSCGGIRMSPSVTLDEVRSLAKNMTLKYGFLGVPTGGAKAGIRTTSTLSRRRKRLILVEFGKKLSRIIKNERFIPGTDMGTSDEDVAWFLNGAYGQKTRDQKIKSGSGSEYTSWTMLIAARQALNTLKDNRHRTRQQTPHELERTTAGIEGFGKIGSFAARTFSEHGVKIVAISTCKGAIYNPKGLDVNMLLDLRNTFGDGLVDMYHEAQRIARDHLVQLPFDMLLPCAGSYTINSRNAYKVRAKVVCSGANIPLTDQAEKILFKKGVVCVPDFVSNSGAVLGNYMAGYVGRKTIRRIMDEEFSARVYELLKISRERNTYPKRVATEIALRRFHEIKGREGNLPKVFLRTARFVLPDAFEKTISKSVASMIFRRKLRRPLS